MNVFVIHRFNSRLDAAHHVFTIAKHSKIEINPILLHSNTGEHWKIEALSELTNAEAVIIYDRLDCEKSCNASWEINKATELNKPIICIDSTGISKADSKKLTDIYHDEEEFNSYFRNSGSTFDLYKMMVDSSEQLIQRRQRVNSFFITAIGSLLTIVGALTKFGAVNSPTLSFLLLTAFGIIGLLLCNSWRNLIENYGRLNSAKYRVILKLEQSLTAQVFSAEWAALGKGRRPGKYQSFTNTENKVPLWFAVLIFSLLIFSCLWELTVGQNFSKPF